MCLKGKDNRHLLWNCSMLARILITWHFLHRFVFLRLNPYSRTSSLDIPCASHGWDI